MKSNPCFAQLLKPLLVVVLLTGCADPERAPLIGRWVLEQPDRVLDRIDGKSAKRNQAIDSVGDSTATPKMLLAFYSNGRFETQTAIGNVNRQKNGNWEVISFDEAGQKMTIRCKIGSEETDHPVELIDRSTIQLLPPNMAGLSLKMRFVRDE